MASNSVVCDICTLMFFAFFCDGAYDRRFASVYSAVNEYKDQRRFTTRVPPAAASPSIVGAIKSRRMRWTGHVARVREINAYKVWSEKLKEETIRKT
jgi:hypothetical protein